MNGFLKDLRFGLRQLAAKPGFAAAAILTLALGIGANTAMFSILNGYLFKPLPYPHSERLVQVSVDLRNVREEEFGVSPPLYRAIQQQTTAFAATAVYHEHETNMLLDGHALPVNSIVSSASLLPLLGARPLIGRLFAASNMHPGRNHVIVISYGLWLSAFGRDTAVVGQMVKLDGENYRIIGIMPPGFEFPERDASLWVPRTVGPHDFDADHSLALYLHFIGRLKAGVDVEAARSQVRQVVGSYLENTMPSHLKKMTQEWGLQMEARPYRQVLLGDRSSSLWLLQAAVLLVLLITCVNVANLLLSRILGRSHEIAMRGALGATRTALVRQLLVEALCLAVPGGLFGIGLSWLALRSLAGSAFSPGKSIFNMALDWRVGLFALGTVLITAIIISVLPIRHLASPDIQGILQEGGRTASGGTRTKRIRNALVITELTLATGLLAVAGLLLHSFMNLEAVDPGFRKDNILITNLLVSPTDHPGSETLRRFYADVVQRIDTVPGVHSATIAQSTPLGGADNVAPFSILGRKLPVGTRPPVALFNSVSHGFFKTLGILILSGRRFDDRDMGTTHAIVGERLVKTYLPDVNPIGQTIVMGGMQHVIIGVVPSIKYAKLSQTRPSAVIYVNGPEMPPTRHAQLIIHTDLPPKTLIQPVEKLIAKVDPNVAVYDVHTMREQISDALRDKQKTTVLLLAFGAIALALAIVGVYAVMSYAVGQRRAECGIRLALGAQPTDLRRLVLQDGLRLLVVGLALGLGLAVLFGYLLSAQLFGVTPFDPVTLVGSAAILCAITLLACWLPARRASKLDPAEAMMEQ